MSRTALLGNRHQRRDEGWRSFPVSPLGGAGSRRSPTNHHDQLDPWVPHRCPLFPTRRNFEGRFRLRYAQHFLRRSHHLVLLLSPRLISIVYIGSLEL